MDIHEQFSYHVSKLKELVEDIKKAEEKDKEEADDTIIIDDNYVSDWERFVEFLRQLFNDSYNSDNFKAAIIQLILNDEELDLHEQMEKAFNYLGLYDDRILKSIVYVKGSDEITIKYNEVEYSED